MRKPAKEALSHQLMKGLVDPEIQERILAKSGDRTEEMTLQEILQTVEALEAAKRDQTSLSGSRGGLNRQRAGGTPLQLGLEVDRSVQIVGPANTRPKTPAARPIKLYAEDATPRATLCLAAGSR